VDFYILNIAYLFLSIDSVSVLGIVRVFKKMCGLSLSFVPSSRKNVIFLHFHWLVQCTCAKI
jgi:hypothetical protein